MILKVRLHILKTSLRIFVVVCFRIVQGKTGLQIAKVQHHDQYKLDPFNSSTLTIHAHVDEGPFTLHDPTPKFLSRFPYTLYVGVFVRVEILGNL